MDQSNQNLHFSRWLKILKWNYTWLVKQSFLMQKRRAKIFCSNTCLLDVFYWMYTKLCQNHWLPCVCVRTDIVLPPVNQEAENSAPTSSQREDSDWRDVTAALLEGGDKYIWRLSFALTTCPLSTFTSASGTGRPNNMPVCRQIASGFGACMHRPHANSYCDWTQHSFLVKHCINPWRYINRV